MDRIDTIINESINKVLTEDSNRDLAKLIRRFLGKKKKRNKKKRKMENGRETSYDYDEYEVSNGKISVADASSLRDKIDMEKTNIAAIARILFPDHTDEGAQSQLRKILNGERPMTKRVSNKIAKLISGGHIAVK